MSIEQGQILTFANYCPWKGDRGFIEAHFAVKGYTMVDECRCYELWEIVGQASKLSEGAFLEVGTWNGGSGGLIGLKARKEGLSEKVYLCDTFMGVVKAGEHDTAYHGGEHSDASKEKVERLMRKLGLDNVEVLQGVFPEETGGRVDGKIRFCHVDVDVYQSAKDVVEWVWPRLVLGGVVVFDDYGFCQCAGVTKYVNELKGQPDRVVIYNLNGHAVMVKVA